jgi:hypothetical protein
MIFWRTVSCFNNTSMFSCNITSLFCIHSLLSGTREFQCQVQISTISCDVCAPVGVLIAHNVALFLPGLAHLASAPFSPNPSATHIPASCLSQILAIRFPGGGGLDKTTALLCCQISTPVAVQSIEALCDRVQVQWHRLVTNTQRTPAVKLELTAFRFGLEPSLDTDTFESSASSPSMSLSSTVPLAPQTLPQSMSSSSRTERRLHDPCKISLLCDGMIQVRALCLYR